MEAYKVRGGFLLSSFLLVVLLGWVRGDTSEEIRPMVVVEGEHPIGGWQSWEPMDFAVSYFNLTGSSEADLRLWFSAVTSEGRNSMIQLPYQDDSWERVPPLFDTRLVEGYERDLDGLAKPILTRTAGFVGVGGEEIVLGAIGSRYTGGASELVPWLFRRKPGGEWESLGLPPGEPQEFIEAAWREGLSVRAEGGGVVELEDERKRLYLHGLTEPEEFPDWQRGGRLVVPRILVAEADDWEGPWVFRRHENGRLWDIREGITVPWVFPHVQKVSKEVFLLTGASAWPPDRIYAAYSEDGKHFVTPSEYDGSPLPLLRKNEILRGARFVKALRGVYLSETEEFRAVVSVAPAELGGRSVLLTTRGGWDEQNLNRVLYELEIEGSERTKK
ncbi:MAG: hypothetical protein JJT75_09360 [Opitutales bacterium]|nr:hypothetical protein [Opitutales bacterium]